MITNSMKNISKSKAQAIGGTRKTWGLLPMYIPVHFMTATPIAMFFRLHKTQQSRRNAITQTPYEPYKYIFLCGSVAANYPAF